MKTPPALLPPTPPRDLAGEDIRQAVLGEPEATRRVVERLQQPVTGLIHRLVGGRLGDQVEDIAQDVFLKIFRNLHKFEPERGVKLSTWVFAIVRNHCFDVLRTLKNTPISLSGGTEGEDNVAEPEDRRARKPLDHLLDRELRQRIDAAIHSLQPAQRNVLVLREYEGLPYTAIARLTGTGEDTVRTRLHRARKTLRGYLEPYLRAS